MIPPTVSEKTAVNCSTLMKFDFCYYGQVNSLRLKSSVALKWASKNIWGTIYFTVDSTRHHKKPGNRNINFLDSK